MKTKLAITFTALIALTTLATAQGSTVSFDSILVNTDPAPVQSGEDAEITFKIRNTGDTEAEDVEVEVMDSYPFELKPDRKRNYERGDIVPGESYQITSEVLVAEDSPDGKNDFKVKVKQGDFEVVKKIPITVQSEDIELNLANLETSPDDLKPDTENNQLNLEVVNNGDKTAENVVVELDLPEEFEERSSFSTRQSLGNIEEGEVKEATFDFDIGENASEGSKTVGATISYSADDNTAEISQEEDFKLYVSGKPQYTITSIESDLQAGEKGEIRLTVENFGSVKSESTRVRILDNSDLPFEFDSSNRFMGTLEPGKEGEVVFEPEVEAEASGKEYLLDFEVRGVKDSEVFVGQKVNSLEVENKKEQGTSPIAAIAAFLLAAVSGAYVFRNRSEVKNRINLF